MSLQTTYNNLDLAENLKQESLVILDDNDLWHPFTKYGKIHLVGSAKLDLLVYPDLDIYFDYYDDDPNVSYIFAEAANVVRRSDVSSIKIAKDLYKTANFPRGIYMQIKLKLFSKIWKIDIWHLENQNELKEKMEETEQLKSEIDPGKKKLILEAKNAIKQPNGKPPSFASFYIYQAVLKEKLTDVDAIKKYVVACVTSKNMESKSYNKQ